MSYKPDEKDWMAYLYGEMEEGDKKRFDEYILQNPVAKQELEKYQNLRTILSIATDKEVIAPPIFVGDDGPSANARAFRTWNSGYVRIITAVAASLILIILVGRLSGTQLIVSDHEFRLSFKDAAVSDREEEPAENSVSPETVQTMINASLEKNNDLVKASLEETQRKLNASIRTNLALTSGKLDQLVREASLASQDQIRQYVEGIRSENMQQVKDYFQLTSTEQKKYIENLLIDFNKYLEQQRNNDLQLRSEEHTSELQSR